MEKTIKNVAPPDNLERQNNEISLWDVMFFVRQGWRWLSAGLVVGLIGSISYVLVTPRQYEATAVIQPATVGMPLTTNITRGAEIEPVAQTLERLKIATFYTPELVRLCQAPSRQALASSVKVSQVKGNSLVQVSYRATTTGVAEACVSAVVGQLKSSQAAIAEPLIKTLEEQLSLTKRQLTEAEAFQAQLEKRATSSSDAASLLMLNALSKREEILRLQKILVEQKVQLSTPLTQPMQLLEHIYVPEWPVVPKRLLVLAGGVFGGLALGGLAFFVRRIWLGRKAA